MTRSIVVRVMWGPRPEPLEQCALRLRDCFSRLAELGAIFSEWFERRNTPIPGRAVPWSDLAVLRRLLEKGIHYTDIPRAPIPDLGYLMGLWNGNHRSDGADIQVSCGGYSKYVGNRAVLTVSDLEGGFPPIDLIWRSLAALVDAWAPDSGEAFQLIPKDEDFDELHCAGYTLKPIILRENVQVRALGRGTLWFDEAAYERFV